MLCHINYISQLKILCHSSEKVVATQHKERRIDWWAKILEDTSDGRKTKQGKKDEVPFLYRVVSLRGEI